MKWDGDFSAKWTFWMRNIESTAKAEDHSNHLIRFSEDHRSQDVHRRLIWDIPDSQSICIHTVLAVLKVTLGLLGSFSEVKYDQYLLQEFAK